MRIGMDVEKIKEKAKRLNPYRKPRIYLVDMGTAKRAIPVYTYKHTTDVLPLETGNLTRVKKEDIIRELS